MSDDVIPNGESKYQVTELPNGFIVTGQDRNPVIVQLESTCFVVDCDINLFPDPRGRYSLFSYYDLSRAIATGLMVNWRPPAKEGQKGTPRWLKNWAIKQTAGTIGKRVHNQWKRLLTLADPAVVAVQRALFAATGGKLDRHLKLWAYPGLYRDRWLVRDVIQYRAAALAVAAIGDLQYIRSHFKSWQAEQAFEASPQKVALEELAQALGFEITISTRDIRIPDPELAPLEALHNWRGLFSPTGEPYRSLNRTLMNLPGGVPVGLVERLAILELPRPITDRVELAFTLAYAGRTVTSDPKIGIVAHAQRWQVLKSMQRVNAADHLNLNHRRVRSLIDLAYYLADYPEPYLGNVVGLADKAITWHREQRTQEVDRIIKELGGDTLAASPPVELPKQPGVTFLSNVAAICEEGQHMGHCLASYAEAAVEGRCYLFHVEHAGEQATIQVVGQTGVVQARGPMNKDNKAVAWGRRALNRWGRSLPGVFPPF